MLGNKDLYHVICFVELAMGSPTGTKPKSLKERTEWAHFVMTAERTFFWVIFVTD